MKNALIGLLGLTILLAQSSCAIVVATATTVSAVTATTVTTAGKVTVAAVKSGGKMAASAVTSSGDVTSLSMETAAKLARAGMVVTVDSASGAITEMPWEKGMRLYGATKSGKIGAAYDLASIFRKGKRIDADLRRVRQGLDDHVLKSGDVLELRRTS